MTDRWPWTMVLVMAALAVMVALVGLELLDATAGLADVDVLGDCVQRGDGTTTASC